MAIFQTFFLGNTGLEIVFYDILETKNAFLGYKNNRFKPYGKMSIFRLFELLLFIVLKGGFCLQNIRKDIFLAYIAKKKEIDKTAIFGQQPSVNPFEKMSTFRIFELLLFIALKGVFSF